MEKFNCEISLNNFPVWTFWIPLKTNIIKISSNVGWVSLAFGRGESPRVRQNKTLLAKSNVQNNCFSGLHCFCDRKEPKFWNHDHNSINCTALVFCLPGILRTQTWLGDGGTVGAMSVVIKWWCSASLLHTSVSLSSDTPNRSYLKACTTVLCLC